MRRELCALGREAGRGRAGRLGSEDHCPPCPHTPRVWTSRLTDTGGGPQHRPHRHESRNQTQASLTLCFALLPVLDAAAFRGQEGLAASGVRVSGREEPLRAGDGATQTGPPGRPFSQGRAGPRHSARSGSRTTGLAEAPRGWGRALAHILEATLGRERDDQSWSHQTGREVVIGGPLVRRHRALPRMNSIPEYAYMGRASPLTGAGGGGATLMLPEQPRPSGLPGGSALGLETCPRHLPGPWSLPKTPSPPAFPSRGVLPHPTEDLSRAHTHRHMGTFMGHTRLPS